MDKQVAEKYNLVGITPGRHQFPEYGTIDLSKITLSVADQLFAAGFPHLEKRKKREASEVPKN